jgi:hypothetical protein
MRNILAEMNQTRFMIVTGPPQLVAPGSCYVAQDGSPTMMKSKAARFNSVTEVKAFAETNHLVLNARTYIIGREEFTELNGRR